MEVITADNLPYDHNSQYHGILFDSIIAEDRDLDCDVFLGAGNTALYQMREVKRLGGKCVTTWWSSHWANSQRILDEEYRRLGLGGYSHDSLQIWRCQREQALSDRLITPSEFCTLTYEADKMLASKVSTVHFGVDLEKFQPPINREPNKEYSVLFTGGNWIRKGLQLLVAAVHSLRAKGHLIHLIILGADVPQQLRLDFVEVLGWIPDEKVPEIYHRADLFCLPSLEEGSALVSLEALASGLPIVVTRQSGAPLAFNEAVPEVVQFIEPTVDSIAEGILTCYLKMKDNASYYRVGARALAEKYPWSKFGAGIIRVLEECL